MMSCLFVTLCIFFRNKHDYNENGKGRLLTRAATNSRCSTESFEIISYRDSIKTVDCSGIGRRFGLHWFEGCRLWIVKDVCGGICVTLTWFLLIFAESVVCSILLATFDESLHTAINGVIFQLMTFLAVTSHLRCMFTDPVRKRLDAYSFDSLVFLIKS